MLLLQRAVVERLWAETQGRLVFSARMLEAAFGIIALERERCFRQPEDREDWQRTMARRWLVAFRQIQQAAKRAKLANWVKQVIGLADGPAGRRPRGKVSTVAEDGRAASVSPGVCRTQVDGSPDELIPDEEEEEGSSQGVPAGQRTPRQCHAKDSFDTEYFVGFDSELACPWRQVPGRREREYASCVVPDVDALSPAIAKWDDGFAHPVAELLSCDVKCHAARNDHGGEARAEGRVQVAGNEDKKQEEAVVVTPVEGQAGREEEAREGRRPFEATGKEGQNKVCSSGRCPHEVKVSDMGAAVTRLVRISKAAS